MPTHPETMVLQRVPQQVAASFKKKQVQGVWRIVTHASAFSSAACIQELTCCKALVTAADVLQKWGGLVWQRSIRANRTSMASVGGRGRKLTAALKCTLRSLKCCRSKLELWWMLRTSGRRLHTAARRPKHLPQRVRTAIVNTTAEDDGLRLCIAEWLSHQMALLLL